MKKLYLLSLVAIMAMTLSGCLGTALYATQLTIGAAQIVLPLLKSDNSDSTSERPERLWDSVTKRYYHYDRHGQAIYE